MSKFYRHALTIKNDLVVKFGSGGPQGNVACCREYKEAEMLLPKMARNGMHEFRKSPGRSTKKLARNSRMPNWLGKESEHYYFRSLVKSQKPKEKL